MTDQNRPAFMQLMTLVFNSYGKAEDVHTSGLYFKLLRDHSLADVALAVDAHMTDTEVGSFWPKPADLIRKIQGGSGSRALEAWDVADRAAGGVCSAVSVKFSDPLIHAVIDRMGGWWQFCQTTEDWTDEEGHFHKGNKDFKRKEFCERYANYLQRPPADIPSYLPGSSETTTRQSKFAHEPRAALAYRVTPIGEAGRSALPPGVPVEGKPKLLPSAVVINALPDKPDFIKRLGSGSRSDHEPSDFDDEKYRKMRGELDERERARRLKSLASPAPESAPTNETALEA